MKIILLFLALSAASCTRWQWVTTEVKISTVGQRVHIEKIGDPVPIGDTTIRAQMISKIKVPK